MPLHCCKEIPIIHINPALYDEEQVRIFYIYFKDILYFFCIIFLVPLKAFATFLETQDLSQGTRTPRSCIDMPIQRPRLPPRFPTNSVISAHVLLLLNKHFKCPSNIQFQK